MTPQGEQAALELDRSEPHQGDRGPERDDGERDRVLVAPDPQRGEDDQGTAHGPRQHDAPGLLDAGVAPHLSVQPEEVIGQKVQERDDRDEGAEAVPEMGGNRSVEPQHQDGEIRDEDHAEIEESERDVTPDMGRHLARQPRSQRRGQLFVLQTLYPLR